MWYSASLFFKSVHSVGTGIDPLWEEVILLISAADVAEARTTAEQLGKSREHEYTVDSPVSHSVRWRLFAVERICEVDESLANGTEIFARFIREREALSLLTPFE